MQQDLNENNQAITKFNTEVDDTHCKMSQSLNQKFRLAKEYQEKVRERMNELEHKVYKSADITVAPLAMQSEDRSV